MHTHTHSCSEELDSGKQCELWARWWNTCAVFLLWVARWLNEGADSSEKSMVWRLALVESTLSSLSERERSMLVEWLRTKCSLWRQQEEATTQARVSKHTLLHAVPTAHTQTALAGLLQHAGRQICIAIWLSQASNPNPHISQKHKTKTWLPRWQNKANSAKTHRAKMDIQLRQYPDIAIIFIVMENYLVTLWVNACLSISLTSMSM